MSVIGHATCPYYRFLFVLISFLFGSVCPNMVRTIGVKHHNYHESREIYDSSTPVHVYEKPYNGIFDVLSFGAKGDGIADDSKAFMAAWVAACSVGLATVEFPSEFRFLIGPITLQGPCKLGLVLQIDGMIIAPRDLGVWPKSGLLQWINFKNLRGFMIQGSGTIDGQGSAWWTIPEFQLNQVTDLLSSQPTSKNSKNYPKVKPTAVRFYASHNITIRDIGIQNSPLCHLKFDNCAGVTVSNITISSPGDSPNTDGIHLQNSQEVEVQYSSISCGDDCVSIQTGCSNVHIHDIKCGPGHGISIGSLGRDGSLACVSEIIVQNITMYGTLYGVRIKTWQGGIGSVKSVSFSNIQVSNVKIPIDIDQFYCDKRVCPNTTNAVVISDINYNQINGTYSTQAIHLACSNSVPCTNISIGDILLTPSVETHSLKQALCWNAFGKSEAPLLPTNIDCLETTDPYKNAENLNKTHLTC